MNLTNLKTYKYALLKLINYAISNSIYFGPIWSNAIY